MAEWPDYAKWTSDEFEAFGAHRVVDHGGGAANQRLLGGIVIPNPGSPEAKTLGCRCSSHDNNHGRFPPMGLEWHIAFDCPIHDDQPEPGRS